jgi:formyl-CoA transferase
LQAQVSLLDFQAARWLIAKEVPGQAGNDHPTSIPTGVFPTSDGHINIAAAGAHIFRRFCKALNLEHLESDPRFSSAAARSANRKEINEIISRTTRQKPSREWIEILNAAGVPSGPINKMDEVFQDRQVQHLGMAAPVPHATLGDVHVVNQPIKLSRTPSRMVKPTPEKGEHTDEVLREYGFGEKDIEELRRGGIV